MSASEPTHTMLEAMGAGVQMSDSNCNVCNGSPGVGWVCAACYGKASAASFALSVEYMKRGTLLEMAWGIIANAAGGDWDKESAEWIVAASQWRDRYFALFSSPSDKEGVRAYTEEQVFKALGFVTAEVPEFHSVHIPRIVEPFKRALNGDFSSQGLPEPDKEGTK